MILGRFLTALFVIASPVVYTGAQTRLSCGDWIQGEISTPGERENYIFTGRAGEAVQLAGETLDFSFQPEFVVFDPTGAQIGIKSIAETRSGAIALPNDGEYTILVKDFLDENTGRFVLSLEFTTGRCSTGISCGETVFGTVRRRGEQRSYRFSGLEGEAVRVLAAMSNSERFPTLELFDPNGQSVGWTSRGESQNLPLLGDGDYTLVVSDFFSFFEDPKEDSFFSSLQFTTGRCTLNNSGEEAVDVKVLSELQQDAFTFVGKKNSWVHIQSEPLDFLSWSPGIVVYDPFGIVAGTGSTQSLDLFLAREGTYTALLASRQEQGRRFRTRISGVGADQFAVSSRLSKSSLGGTSVAFNSQEEEFLVVYSWDVSGFGEYEILAQRLDANTLDPIGQEIRVSSMGDDLDPDSDAFEPGVAYSPASQEYLVVWSGDDGVDNDFEIYAQRINAETGAPQGTNDFRLSSTGVEGDPAYDAYRPKIVFNHVEAEYFVVWYGNGSGSFDVYGLRLNLNGSQLGSPVKVASGGEYPDVSYNRDRNEYFVVWQAIGPGQTVPVSGVRIDGATGSPLQTSSTLVSVNAGSSRPERGVEGPSIAYNGPGVEYLVVWAGIDDLIYGQRLDAASGQIRGPLAPPVSLSGTSRSPDVEFNDSVNEFLVVWERDLGAGKWEISGQRIDAIRSLRVGSVGFQVSETGPDGSPEYSSHRPAVAVNSSSGDYLAVWQGNLLVDGGNAALARTMSGQVGSHPGSLSWLVAGNELEGGEDVLDLYGIPAVDSEGSVYSLGGTGPVSVFSPEGALRWRIPSNSSLSNPGSLVVGADDSVFLTQDSGEPGRKAMLLSYGSGGLLNWSVDLGEGQWMPLALDSEGSIFGALAGNGLKAFNPSGQERWSLSDGFENVQTGPVLSASGELLIGIQDPSSQNRSLIAALDKGGTVLREVQLDWVLPTGYSLALGSDGTLYVGGAFLGAIGPEGVLKWKVPAANGSGSGICFPIVSPNGNIVCSGGNAVQIISREGERLAHFFGEAEDELFSRHSAVGGDGTIYVASTIGGVGGVGSKGIVYAIDPGADLLWRLELPEENFSGSAVTLDQSGNVLVVSQRGILYSIHTGYEGFVESGWSMVGHDPGHSSSTSASEAHFLNFAQFADGAGALSSQIILLNPSENETVQAEIDLRGDDGEPLSVDLNGEEVNGKKQLSLGPGSVRVLETDSLGDLTVGSASVESTARLGGVILFGGTVGLAGVGNSFELTNGFVAPMETNRQQGVNTGVAIMNLDNWEASVDLELYGSDGILLGRAALEPEMKPRGHIAAFVDSFSWDNPVDFTDFSGILKVDSSSRVSATVIQTRPGKFATMPVSSQSSQKWGKLKGLRLPDVQLSVAEENPYRLHFAQFADGAGALFSQIILFNPGEAQSVSAELTMRDDDGNPLSVDLNGEMVHGVTSVEIPPMSLQVLKTDGLGDVVVGSALVEANHPVSGVIVFGGVVGLAGVGSSRELNGGFLAPMQVEASREVNTGVALMSLETSDVEISLKLCDLDGRVLAGAELAGEEALKGGGHLARFVDQFDWDRVVDFSDFVGVLKVVASGRISATVIQTRPEQFATMPVIAYRPD